MKTYIVSVWYDLFGRDTVEIIYAGQDEHKAFNTDISKYITAEVEVWEDNKRKSLYRRDYQNNKWKLEVGMR